MANLNSNMQEETQYQEPTTQIPPKSPNISQEIPITTANAASTSKLAKKLTLIPLIFLIYFEVAGGPYGEEPAVQAAGPLFALLGFLVFPFIWSVPEALITAELSTAYPGNGGFVIWAERAFGPFFGSLMGSWKFLSGVINVAAFPVLCIDYMKKAIPSLNSGWPRKLAITSSTLILSFLNYTGLTIVGYVAVLLGIISLLPFILMSLIAIPKIHPHRWLSTGDKGVKKDWTLFFNTLFWNLNFWDNVSTLAGEVDKPQKTFPLALFIAVIFTCVSYFIPLLAVTGAVSVSQSDWGSGFHATAAEMIAGKWLKYWVEAGSVLSAVGLYEAQLSTSAYQLLGMLLEFASFLWLRRKFPELKRPYKVPMRLPGLVIMCLVPSVFLVVIMVVATKVVYLVSGLMTVGAIGWYFIMKFCRSKKLFKYSNGENIE
ncbi:hypothetical protein JCGZ_01917 [Jatropha curcas]|uniref:Amino acid permease/ SLC12A domain-containing protein n=1 Tax=Jatropha curcas TaxID=180498 RepID=A0A067LDG6_JATCU|nr:hypothetical protein JCGZ_01917 [Jatropha curcas]